MNYELAKQLKDAGLKQEGWNGNFYDVDGQESSDFGDLVTAEGDEVYIPTLSELIEACGDKFGTLHQYKYPSNNGKQQDWLATEQYKTAQVLKGEGATPEEAVAKLWLELNKK